MNAKQALEAILEANNQFKNWNGEPEQEFHNAIAAAAAKYKAQKKAAEIHHGKSEIAGLSGGLPSEWLTEPQNPLD